MKSDAHRIVDLFIAERDAMENFYERLCARVDRIAPIFEQIYHTTGQFEFPAPWEFVRPDADCRGSIIDAAGLEQSLVDEFSPEQLSEAGVIESEDAQELVLNSKLSDSDGPLIFLRNENGKIYDIVTAEGTCVTDACPLFAIAHDQHTNHCLSIARPSRHRLFGVASMGELALLRALEIAATPVTVLDRLNAAGLRRLMHLVGASSRSCIADVAHCFQTDLFDDHVTDYRSAEGQPKLRLDLVACAFFLPTPLNNNQFQAVVHHLKQASRHLGIRWANINVWWPDASAAEELGFRLRMRSPEMIQEFFQKDHSVHSLDVIESSKGPPPKPSPAVALVAARREMLSAGPRFEDAPGEYEERLRAAEAEFQNLVDVNLVQPMVAQAMKNDDHREGQLQYQLAQTVRMSQIIAPKVEAYLKQSNRNGAMVEGELVPPILWNTYSSLINHQLRFNMELRRKR